MTNLIPRWEIWLDTPQGVRLTQASTAIAFECVRILNDVGAFSITLPGDFDKSKIIEDGLIEFSRSTGDESPRWVLIGFIRSITYTEDVRGENVIILEGPDIIDLLQRRIVAYDAGSSYAEKTDLADDMMKEIVAENLGASATADTDRDLTNYNFSILADLGEAPSVTKSFAWRNVLKVIQDLADTSEQAGTRLFFDIIPYIATATQLGFRFYTSIDQLGEDHTGTDMVLFSKEWGNLADPELLFDYSREENYIYVGGQGEEDARQIEEVSDSDRVNMSIWNRREGFEDARHVPYSATGASAELTVIGNAALTEGKPKLKFKGKLLDTEQTRYGIDWGFGDKVVVAYRGFQFDAFVKSIYFRYDKNGERLDARVELDE